MIFFYIKCNALGLEALCWIGSNHILYGRKQYLSVNGQSSPTCSMAYDAPQGSILVPLLFLIYINDLPNSSKLLSFYLIADDTNIYSESNDLPKLVKVVTKNLRFESWLDCNKLAINIDRTNFVFFYSPRKRSQT